MTLLYSIKRGITVAICAMTAAGVSAIDLPVTTVNGKDFYYYDVQPKETLFSLSQRLGISREEIVAYNPGVDGGLKAYTRLYFPVEAGVTSISAGDHITTSHEVGKGETLYGISKKYGISVDRLIALNPSARDGIKSGDTLVILQEETPVETATGTTHRMASTHTIAQGETLYRIAVNNGITVEQLLAANPGIDAYNYSEGTVINIPGSDSTPVHSTPAVPSASATNRNDIADIRANAVEVRADDLNSISRTTTVDDNTAKQKQTPAGNAQQEQPMVTPAAEYAETAESDSQSERSQEDPFNIAVMLPFNLDETETGKEAENFTEFYRGFLLAAQNLSNSGRKVNIHTYDTRGNLDTVKELMTGEEMKEMDIFVAPTSTAELDHIIASVDSDRQFVFNTFAVRNTAYQDNSNVIQANIPHTRMYQRAIDAFMQEMAGRTPIFIQRIGGTADKEEFTSMLKSQLADKGIEYKEITYENTLKDGDFAGFDASGSYVIVPLSSSATEFNKIVPATKRFKDTLTSASGLAMFGYPEWLTFRGERKENLGTLNATIYSRFYNDESYYPSRRLAETYRQVYGRDMNTAVPSQAMMGYDVASYIIKSLRANNGDFHINITPYEGLQTDFIFTDSDCDGLVNTAVEIIKFREGGFTEHHNI